MSEIGLTSEVYEITATKRKTKARVMENWRVGDRIQLSTQIEYKGGAAGGIYATYIYIHNLTQDNGVWKSQSETAGIFGGRYGIFGMTKEGGN